MIFTRSARDEDQEVPVLLDELGGLTLFQRTALTTALNTSGSADCVISLLEAEFDKALAYGRCGSKSFAG